MVSIIAAVVLAIFVVLIALGYWYFTSTFNYWRDKGVPFVKPYPLVGSMWRTVSLQEHMTVFFKRVYFQYKDQPFVGYFQGISPSLLLRDPDLIKTVLVKDFSHFTDHGIDFNEETDPLIARNLFNMKGQTWKDMRSSLLPTFTSGRMKAMFPLVLECGKNLEKYLHQHAICRNELELKDLMTRYTTSVIATSVFGIICDAMQEPNHIFRESSKKIVETDFIQGLKVAAITFIPGINNILTLKFFKEGSQVYFKNIMDEVMAMREKSGEKRNDFLQLLMELKETGKISQLAEDMNEKSYFDIRRRKFTDTDILAQALVFFFAGFETSSTAMAIALFELSTRPELQRKARKHIEEVLARHKGEITHDALLEMTYLDWILQESLRKYPSLPLFRICTKDYVIPNTDIRIEKGIRLMIPTHALHYDSQYFDKPDQFIPERWADEDMIKRNQYIYMPFGEGPRICVGMRFARMQSKLGLLSFLRKYELSSSGKTKTPLVMDPQQFLICPQDNILVKIQSAER